MTLVLSDVPLLDSRERIAPSLSPTPTVHSAENAWAHPAARIVLRALSKGHEGLECVGAWVGGTFGDRRHPIARKHDPVKEFSVANGSLFRAIYPWLRQNSGTETVAEGRNRNSDDWSTREPCPTTAHFVAILVRRDWKLFSCFLGVETIGRMGWKLLFLFPFSRNVYLYGNIWRARKSCRVYTSNISFCLLDSNSCDRIKCMAILFIP